MANDAAAIRPSALSWVNRQLEVGERVIRTQALHGGTTADVRRLTIAGRGGTIRDLVLRTYVDPYFVARAEDLLTREANALSFLTTTGVPAPALVAVDPTGAHCEYPSLLMTYLPGRSILNDEKLEARVPLLARQLAAIHRLQPAKRPPPYETLTTADTVVVPKCADAAIWAAAIDMIRQPVPSYEGRLLHRDFQPANVLFDVSPEETEGVRLVGVIDWAGTSWGPADLDVAHCCMNLALLYDPAWAMRFVDAYEDAGGVLAATASDRLYWLVRDGLAASEEVHKISELWRQAGRTDLTTQAVEKRLDIYVTSLMTEVR